MTEPLSMDQAFIDKLSEIVLANLQNENFGVNDLASEAVVSRYIIHRRLRKLKNQNISQFIREIRLKRAFEMLQEHTGTASDIAYKVGFGSPAYFNKCFHEYFGYPPGEVKKMIRPEEETTNLQIPEVVNRPGHSRTALKEVPATRKRTNRTIMALISVITVVSISLVLVLFLPGHERDQSIIVIPFKNLTSNPDNQYIADGIMEDILNNLYYISNLRVISRTTSEHFRITDLTTGEIGRKVNASNVLEGSIRMQEDKIRLSIQLIDAYKDTHLWSANFDREITDLLGLQGEIAMKVAGKLNVVISDTEAKQLDEIPTKNQQAYDYYQKGRFLLHRSINNQRTAIDGEGFMRSVEYFEKAVAADENFAEAYASMAQAWFDLSAWGFVPTKEGFLKAKTYSIKALEIDPDCAVAHSAKGAYHGWGDRDFEEARKEFLAALKAKPDYPIVNQYYAQLLMITGPIEEARVFMDNALKLEPYFWVLHNLNAYIYYFEGKHKEALNSCQIARDMNDDYLLNDWLFFLNYSKLDQGKKAAEELQKIIRSVPDTGNYADEIPEVYRKSGIKGLFSWMTDININRPLPVFGLSGEPFFISWWYAILGDKEKSIYWLEKNMEKKWQRHAYSDLITTNPDFDILRNDPRFMAIIEKTGLKKYNTRKAR